MGLISQTTTSAKSAIHKSASHTSSLAAAPLHPTNGRETSFSFERSSPALSHKQSWLSFDFAEHATEEIEQIASGLKVEQPTLTLNLSTDAEKRPSSLSVTASPSKREPEEPRLPKLGAVNDLAYFLKNTGPPDTMSRSVRSRRGDDRKGDRRKIFSTEMFKKPRPSSSPAGEPSSRLVLNSGYKPSADFVQKTTTDGKKYLQIVQKTDPEQPSKQPDPPAPGTPDEASDEHAVSIESLEKWMITDFCLSSDSDNEGKTGHAPERQSTFPKSELPSIEIADHQNGDFQPTHAPPVESGYGFGLSIIDDEITDKLNPLRSHPPSSDATPGHSRGASNGTVDSEPYVAIELATRVIVERSTSIKQERLAAAAKNTPDTKRRQGRGVVKLDSPVDVGRSDSSSDRSLKSRELSMSVRKQQARERKIRQLKGLDTPTSRSPTPRSPVARSIPTDSPKPESPQPLSVTQSPLPESPLDRGLAKRRSKSLERTIAGPLINAALVPRRSSSLTHAKRLTPPSHPASETSGISISSLSPMMLVSEEESAPKPRPLRKPGNLVLNERRPTRTYTFGLHNDFGYPAESTTATVSTSAVEVPLADGVLPDAPPIKRLELPRRNFSSIGSSRGQAATHPTSAHHSFSYFDEAHPHKGLTLSTASTLLNASMPGPTPAITPTQTPKRRTNSRIPRSGPTLNSLPLSTDRMIQLEGRNMALERENQLLNAALWAVLRTGGAMNKCPCSVLGRKGGNGEEEDGSKDAWRNRRSMHSQSSDATNESAMSVLDVYFGTRIDASSPVISAV